jgi:tRNA (guanine-N7-)-methyltransferase
MKQYNQERQYHGRRSSRPICKTKRKLIQELLPDIQIQAPLNANMETINPHNLFNQKCDEYWLEIGFGGGENMLAQAAFNPEIGYIGAEPFINGVANAITEISDKQLQNIRIFTDDVRMLLRRLPENSLAKVFILFPDPWPKKRHFKRRIIQQSLLDMLSIVMQSKAELVIATDHNCYLNWILDVFANQSKFKEAPDNRKSIYQRPDNWVSTKYEQKAFQEGRDPAYLFYTLDH